MDFIPILLAAALFLACLALIPLFERLGETAGMTLFYLVALVLSLSLLVYLFAALLRPEFFS